MTKLCRGFYTIFNAKLAKENCGQRTTVLKIVFRFKVFGDQCK